MKKNKTTVSTVALLAMFALHCNNYGLLDKLANPTGSSSGISSNQRYIFVASTVVTGSMGEFQAPFGCPSSGLLAADCGCGASAFNAGLSSGGTIQYIAWLSTGSNASTPIDMTCRIQRLQGIGCTIPSGGPQWVNTQNQPVANGYTGLFNGGTLQNPIQYDESGASVNSQSVLTGTNANGQALNDACGSPYDWTLASATAETGDSTAVNSAWTAYGSSGSCSSASSRIYCVGLP